MSRSIKKIHSALKTLLGDRPGSVLTSETERYREYLSKNLPTEEELERQRREDVGGLPVFAVAVTGGKDSSELKRTQDSLAAQTYTRWVLGADGEDWDYIMYMRPGDVLAPDALYMYAHSSGEHDLLYCDEDLCGTDGRERPVLKGAPDMTAQLSYDMLGSGVAVSSRLHRSAGAVSEDSPDDRYGYNLRCLKRAKSPCHIPRILYTCAGESRITPEARIHVEQAAGRGHTVMPGEWPGSFRVAATLKRKDAALIISCRNNCSALLRLLMSIDITGAQGTDIIIADRGSTDARTLKYYDILKRTGAARIFSGGDICMPALLNRAAAETDAEAALFMECTGEVLSHDLTGELLAQTMRRDVGAAGPRIIAHDGRLLHCGTVVGMGGWRGSPYQGCEDDRGDERKRIFTRTLRRVSALSSICMMVRLDTFFNAGCFDESFRSVGFDTEFCLRMGARGSGCVYVPGALVKSYVPPASIDEADEQDLQRCYDAMRETMVKGDPYYNINYDYVSAEPRIAVQPEPPIYLNTIFKKK